MSAYRVGLTGGIGSGKTTVADLFAAQGIVVVDTDRIAHALTAAGGLAMEAIRSTFGAAVVGSDGALNRPAMRQHVFADAAARCKLEAILHPLIARQAIAECEAAISDYVIVAVPLLAETPGWRQRCDRVLVVDCEESVQIRRVMARSALSEPEVRAILAAQATRQERLAIADDVIPNDGGFDALRGRVDALHGRYLAFAGAKKLQAAR